MAPLLPNPRRCLPAKQAVSRRCPEPAAITHPGEQRPRDQLIGVITTR
jgi:hypothetical protein